jgi:hypothetical protein
MRREDAVHRLGAFEKHRADLSPLLASRSVPTDDANTGAHSITVTRHAVPVLHGAFFIGDHCPARGRRVKGGPTGRRKQFVRIERITLAASGHEEFGRGGRVGQAITVGRVASVAGGP